jgi:hypothetical protein
MTFVLRTQKEIKSLVCVAAGIPLTDVGTGRDTRFDTVCDRAFAAMDADGDGQVPGHCLVVRPHTLLFLPCC